MFGLAINGLAIFGIVVCLLLATTDDPWRWIGRLGLLLSAAALVLNCALTDTSATTNLSYLDRNGGIFRLAKPNSLGDDIFHCVRDGSLIARKHSSYI